MEYIIESTVDPLINESCQNFQRVTGQLLTKIVLVLTTPVECKHGEIVDSDHKEFHEYFLNNVLKYMTYN